MQRGTLTIWSMPITGRLELASEIGEERVCVHLSIMGQA